MYILASDLLIHGCTRPQKYQRYWLALVTEAIRNTYSNHHETRYDATHGSIPQRMTLLTLFGIAQLWAPSIPLHSLNSPSWRVANYSLTSQFISIQSELAWAEALREQKWYLAVRFNGHTSLIPGLPAITKLWAKHWFDSKECTPTFDVCRPDVFHFGAMWWHPPFADNNPDQSQIYMSNPNMPCIHHPCPVLLFGLFNLGGVLYTPSQNISYPRQFGGKKKLKTSMTEWLSKCVRSYFRHTFPIFSHGSLLPGLQAVPSASGFGAFSFLALPLASVQMSILVPRRSIPLTLATRELSRLPVYVLQRKWETVGYKCYCPSCPTYPSVAQMWQLISLFLCCSRWM